MANRFVEAGGNFFDTSNIYNQGQSETMLGNWLKSRGNRSQFVIATKVFFPTGEGPNDTGLSRKHIYDQIAELRPATVGRVGRVRKEGVRPRIRRNGQ